MIGPIVYRPYRPSNARYGVFHKLSGVGVAFCGSFAARRQVATVSIACLVRCAKCSNKRYHDFM